MKFTLFIWIMFLVLLGDSYAKDSVLGRKYFQKSFGHLHKSASSESNSLTIIQCSHSVKILKMKNEITGWVYAQVGDDSGYIQDKFLSEKRPSCFQARYPKFYSKMNLDITDMYYWGRLYDQYREGRSRVK